MTVSTVLIALIAVDVRTARIVLGAGAVLIARIAATIRERRSRGGRGSLRFEGTKGDDQWRSDMERAWKV